MSTTRTQSCYAYVKYHTALIIAQHWRCPSTTQHQALLNTGDVNHEHTKLLCICQAPHSTNPCSTLAMYKHHQAPRSTKHCSTLAMSTTRTQSCYAYVKHHT